MFEADTFAANVSAFDGKSLEELFANLRPGRIPSALGGAIVDASYAAEDPPLLPRLRQIGLPFVIEPQSIRFAHGSYQATASVANLPYAPSEPLGRDPTRAEIQRLVLGSLSFQSRYEPAAYLVPALPFERPVGAEAETFQKIHETAVAFNGSEVPQRRLLAAAPVGTYVLRSPFSLLGRLPRARLDGIYFQPLEFDPRNDGVERLASYVTFLLCAKEYALPVISGRVGAFGLLLLAFGIRAFDSGLLQRDAFSLRSLQRPRKRDSRGRTVGGRVKRTYMSQLLGSVDADVAQRMLRHRSLRSRFICSQGKCRFDYQAQLKYARAHFLHSRLREVAQLRVLPTQEMRLEAVARMLQAALEQAEATNRVLESIGSRQVQTDYLRRWIAVLDRVSTRRGWRLAS